MARNPGRKSSKPGPPPGSSLRGWRLETRTPHDSLFKQVFRRRAHAAGLIAATVPPDPAAPMNLKRITPAPTELHPRGLRSSRFMDLLFQVPVAGGKDKIFINPEHQSSSDPRMALRVQWYSADFGAAYIGEHGGSRVPRLITVVVHHSRRRRRWTAATDLADLIGLGEASAGARWPGKPSHGYIPFDLELFPAGALEASLRALPFTQLGRVTLMLLRLAPGNEHIGASLEPWMDDLLAIGDTAEGHEIFTGLIVPYLVTVSAAPESELQEIAYLLGPKVEEHYVKTTAGMIEARGRAEVLLEQVSDKWGTPSAQTEDTIRSGTGRELRVWAVAILKEKFLERFLAAPDDPRYNYL